MMFQYILSLLLINTYYQSAAAPDRSLNGGNPIGASQISNSLALLAMKCGNNFLADQMNQKVEECKLTGDPPYTKQQLLCLMFIDINMQLCSAVSSSKLVLPEDPVAKINEKQNINTFCTTTKDWTITNLTEYPLYKSESDDVKLPATCGEICNSNLTNKDTNFYCKYFKWGTDLLKNQVVTATKVASDNPSSSEAADIAVPVGSEGVPSEVQNTGTSTQQLPTSKQPNITKTSTKDVKQVQGNIPVAQGQTNKQSVAATDLEGAGEQAMGDPPVPPIKSTKNTSPVSGEARQVSSIGLMPDAANNIDKEDPLTGDNDPDEDDGDTLEGEIMDGEDRKVSNFLEKNNIDAPKNEYTRIETEDFPEDSDNFFPFFLTAIIVVVLLYILYHNKNKVTKVFFGLVLEGRSNGRRRNSRGHAYRRLDTLEQAMSTNTGAPPSKIIY